MAVRRYKFQRRRERRAEVPDLGMAPPIEADGEEHSALEHRRVSTRWLLGTVLTGFAGTVLIGAAIYAAFDKESRFAEAPVAAGVRREAATGAFVNPGKGDRLVKPVDIAASKQTFKTPTTISVGDREVVRVKGFTRVATNLVTSSAGYSDEVPTFNPLRLLSDARNPVETAPPEPAQLRDDAEITFTTRDLGAVAIPESGPTLNADEIQAQIAEHMRNTAASTGQRTLALPPQLLLMRTSRAKLDPSGGLGYAGPNNPIMAPFSSIEVRMVPENVTEVPRSPAAQQGQNDERLLVVRKNEALEDTLRNAGVMRDQIPRIVAALGAAGRGLTEGQKIKVLFDDLDGTGRMGQVARLSIYADEEPTATIAANDAGAYVSVARLDDGSKTQKPAASDSDDSDDDDTGGMRLYDSLYETSLKQDLPKPLIGDLVRVFANDVDFQRPVAPGDSFEAFYEDNDEQPDARNDLLYASITTHGETYRYYRFVAPDDGSLDYYDETGRSTRKFLIRKPIAAGLQRSGFGLRYHPILHYSRMHTGVDWSAPIGTPIFAAGNGTVIKAARESGYGNRVEIQHANGYVTTYNHMSGFARGIVEGARVRQGQVVGFLGMTGLATGPHLHYEVIVNGHFVDPLRVKLARTRELDARMLASFKKERDRIDGLMAKAPNATRVASARPDTRPDVTRAGVPR